MGFVMGANASGEMIGEFPGLSVLDSDGNLRPTSDFRSVYSSLLEQWLGVDAAPIIPNAGAVRARSARRAVKAALAAVTAAVAVAALAPSAAPGPGDRRGRRPRRAATTLAPPRTSAP